MIYGFLVLALCYAALVVVMAVFQRQLMYFPDKNIGAPAQYGLSGFNETLIKTSDGINIQLWYRPAKDDMPTIIYFHGNASHIGNRAGIYSALAAKGFGVLALSYRGYGKSEGAPSEQGIYNDARAAISYATNTQNIPLSKLMLYGESLGSGVAVQMATEFAVASVMLQAPYMSVVGRAAEMYFYVPVHMLINDKFDSLSKIARVKAPILFFHGELDTTIPIAHGKTLYAAATAPKEAVYFPDVGHNDFDSDIIADEVFAFAKKVGVVKN